MHVFSADRVRSRPARGLLVAEAKWHDLAVTSRPAAAQHLSDLTRLRRVRDRIDREYAQPLDVEALARGAHMSAGHFSREFRLAYGESPYGAFRDPAGNVIRIQELIHG
jgi:AraC-like DNA-binding protein